MSSTTARDTTKGASIKSTKPKFGEFSVRGLRSLEKQLQQDPTLMEDDWLAIFRQAFGMTDKQKAVVDAIPQEAHTQLQQHFAQAAATVRAGGLVRLKVVQEDDRTRALYLMTVPKAEKGGKGLNLRALTAIRIICCDANCGDWHWCWDD